MFIFTITVPCAISRRCNTQKQAHTFDSRLFSRVFHSGPHFQHQALQGCFNRQLHYTRNNIYVYRSLPPDKRSPFIPSRDKCTDS